MGPCVVHSPPFIFLSTHITSVELSVFPNGSLTKVPSHNFWWAYLETHCAQTHEATR